LGFYGIFEFFEKRLLMRMSGFFKTSSILIVSMLNTACGQLFFWPDSVLRETPQVYGFSHDEVVLESGNELLHGWYIYQYAESEEVPRGLIYYLYGNAQNISAHFRSIAWLVEEGWDVFSLDYRGYGRSTGYPSVEAVHMDALVGVQWATHKALEQDIPLVILGQSLGASVAITTIARLDNVLADALILDSPFAGYRMIIREKMRVGWITRWFAHPASLTVTDSFSPNRHVSALPEIPTLILHGCADYVVPCEHSDSLFPGDELHVTIWKDSDAGHVEMFHDLEWQKKILSWLAENT
jgi:uncharacterized protein